MNNTVDNTQPSSSKPKRIVIELAPKYIPYTRWNRFKTKLWNLILPPQIRLYIHDGWNDEHDQ